MLIKQKLLDNGWGPGGWSFYSPETDWHAPNPLGNTFKQQVENIRKHRMANPRFPFSTDAVKSRRNLRNTPLPVGEAPIPNTVCRSSSKLPTPT